MTEIEAKAQEILNALVTLPFAVLEMALDGFLDSEALSFSDCKPRY